MAIRHYHTILADYGTVTQESKHVLAGIFSNVALDRFPGGLYRMHIGMSVAGEPGDPYQITIEGPGLEKPFVVGEGELPPMPEEQNKFEERRFYIMAIGGTVIFRKPGKHFVVLRSGTRTINRHRFGVYQKSNREVKNSG